MSNYQVKRFLLNTLPDLAAEITDQTVDGVVAEMQRDWRPEFERLGVEKPTRKIKKVPDVDAPVRGYLVRATHTRWGDGEHEFVGEVPMSRVTLPVEARHVLASTALGQVVDGDHRLYSLKVFRDYYRDYLTFYPHRVDLITPVRFAGHRFAAVAIYLVYDEGGKLCAYAFEAGMATGKPMVLYMSSNLGPIVRRSGYQPTPFASVDHWYRGDLQLDEDDEPIGFEVEIFKTRDEARLGGTPFFRLSATLERRDDVLPVHPLALTLQAALRVCAIAQARGEEVPGLGPLTGILAPLGRELPWKKEPHS